jgi:hypothetical protein
MFASFDSIPPLAASLDGWQFAGGAAALTLIAATFGKLREFLTHLTRVAIVSVTVRGYQAEAVLLELRSSFRTSKWGPRSYLGWMLHVRPVRRVQLVPMEVTPSAGRLWWRGRGWRRAAVWVRRGEFKDEEMHDGLTCRNWEEKPITLLFLRGTLDPDRLMADAAKRFNAFETRHQATEGRRHTVRFVHGTAGDRGGVLKEVRRDRGGSGHTDLRPCLAHRPLGRGFDELGAEIDGSNPYAPLALNAAARGLIAEARDWKAGETWYRDRGLPWRRGWLLHGPPGTGKTALVRAVSEDLDLPVYAYDLASLKNDELREAWAQMLTEAPCLALLEDVDAVFHGRENVAVKEGGLTFDCLLNCLDGVQRADGLLIVVTTNHPERLDPALAAADPTATRPGRVDRVVELPSLDEDGRFHLARRILAEHPDRWHEVVDAGAGAGDTGAQFQERCGALALRLRFDRAEDATERQSRSTAHREQPVHAGAAMSSAAALGG